MIQLGIPDISVLKLHKLRDRNCVCVCVVAGDWCTFFAFPSMTFSTRPPVV